MVVVAIRTGHLHEVYRRLMGRRGIGFGGWDALASVDTGFLRYEARNDVSGFGYRIIILG